MFDKFDIPDFEGLTADEAFKACEDWADWMYTVADDVSEDQWNELLRTMDANYSRYYERYEG
jgi:hypothetical protein